MKKIFNCIKDIFTRACVYVTAAFFILLIFADFFLVREMQSETLVSFLNLSAALRCFLAAVILASLKYVFKISFLPTAVLRILHYLLAAVSMSVLFVFIPNNTSPRFLFMFTVIFTLVYTILAFVSFGTKRLFSSRNTDDGYEELYNQNN